jgi:hypothetical protein
MFTTHLDQARLQNMKGGMFKNRSYFGYSGQVLKSGICKYYRRKMFDKFEWCVVEMMLFGKQNSALLTNLFNRLRILLMEEIVFTEIKPLSQCIDLLYEIEKLDYETQMHNVLKFSQIVKTCKRGRLVSYINNYYKFNQIEEKIDEVVLDLCDYILKYRKPNDSDELLRYGQLFI